MNVKHLTSGQMAFSQANEILQTVLGSCVSVCIYDKDIKMGGMIHYLLPSKDLAGDSKITQNPLNFANEAIPQLLREFKKRGSLPKNLKVYLFGGGLQEVDGQNRFSSLPPIGADNVKAALEILKKYNLKVHAEKVGVRAGALMVRFNPSTGEVLYAVRQSEEQKKVQISKKKVRVLVVDDSAPMRKIIATSLSKDSQIEVIGEAPDAIVAEKLRQQLKPDVMTLDIQMPIKDGVTYLKEVMRLTPTPTIIVSDLSLKEVSPVMDALEAGAFDYLQKPMAAVMNQFGIELAEKVLSAAKSVSILSAQVKSRNLQQGGGERVRDFNRQIPLIAIGSSTGGIEALKQVFTQLPEQTPPILIVQHIPPVFSAAFAERLNKISKIKVKEAQDGDLVLPNHAYIAPGGMQMKVESKAGQLKIRITDDAPVNRFKPSVDYLFESLTKLNIAPKIHAGILTGMGDDGARAMLKLKILGATTFAQDEASCVVYGMPKVAVEMQAVSRVIELKSMAAALLGSKAA